MKQVYVTVWPKDEQTSLFLSGNKEIKPYEFQVESVKVVDGFLRLYKHVGYNNTEYIAIPTERIVKYEVKEYK